MGIRAGTRAPRRIGVCGCVAFVLVYLAAISTSGRAAELRHENREDVVDSRTEDVVARFPAPGIGIPARLESRRDIFILATAGAAYFEVTVLARPEVPPRRLADILNEALRGTDADPRRIRYDTQDGYAAATCRASRARLGASASAMDAPAGRVADAFRAAGFLPRVLLRVPIHAEAPAVGAAPFHTAHFRWYDRTTAWQEPVRVSARLTMGQRATGLIILFFGGLMVPFWLAALFIGRRGRGSIFDRKELSFRLIIYGSMGVVFVHGLMLLGFAGTETGRMAADLWFGADNQTPFWNGFLVDIGLMLGAGLLNDALERTWYAVSSEAPPPMSSAEKRVRNQVTIFGVGVLAAVLAFEHLYLPSLPRDAPLRHQFSVALWLAVFVAIYALPWWTKRRIKRVTEFEAAPDVERSARQGATAVLTARGSVRVDEGRDAWNAPAIAVEKDGSVVVSRRLADALDADAMRFAVAQAVVEAPAYRRWRRMLYVLAFVPGFWPALYMFALRKIPHPPPPWDLPAMVLPAVAASVPLVFVVRRAYKRMVIAADREALRATGDFGAAERALTTLARVGTAEELRDSGDQAWRTDALCDSAGRLGLTRRD